MPQTTAREYKLFHDWPQNQVTEDLLLLLDAFDVQIQEFLDSIFAFPDLANPEKIPAVFLDVFLMYRGFRTASDFAGIVLTENEKRKLAILTVPLYQQKGTAAGIVNIIRLLLGIESSVLTQYNVDVWKIGVSELGKNTRLFPNADIVGDRPLYTFDIELLQVITQEQEMKIRALVEFMKPMHTHLNRIIQPVPPPDHWELGVSRLGLTTDLHQ